MSENVAIRGALEALLFVSDEPVAPATLAKILEIQPGEVASVLAQLAAEYREQERGIQLREVAGGWRFYSHPAHHEIIENYVLSWDTRKLSQASLEALAVIAYHQPVTRAGVNAVRGVSSEGVISSLVEKGLVREVGRDSGPGNAILYGTTRTFLEKFGLKNLKELPNLEEFAPDEESKKFIRERLSAGSSFAPISETEDELEDSYTDEDDYTAGDSQDVSVVSEAAVEEDDSLDLEVMRAILRDAITEKVEFEGFSSDDETLEDFEMKNQDA